MAGLLVARTSRSPSPRRRTSSRFVLMAVVAGVLLGAMGCAASLAAGHAHVGHDAGDVQVTDETHSGQHLHADMSTTGEAESTPHRDHDSGAPESHPGMACVVSVDLRFPHPSVAAAVERCNITAPVTTTEWSADVDPPVPRSS